MAHKPGRSLSLLEILARSNRHNSNSVRFSGSLARLLRLQLLEGPELGVHHGAKLDEPRHLVLLWRPPQEPVSIEKKS